MAPLTKLDYNTLDVFTTTVFTGNPLGLVHLKGENLSQEQKQQLAIEFNYSETVILYHPPSTQKTSTPPIYNAQIFTPKSELPFAGHPTIGTAVWIFENLEKDVTQITINLKAGPVIAHYDHANGVATASIPHEVRIHKALMSWQRIVEIQGGLSAASKSNELADASMPLVSVVRGMNFVLVDLSRQPELLDKVVPTKNDIAKHSDLDTDFNDGGNLVANVFYRTYPDQETSDSIIRVRQRVMAIELEDPATGSACSALGAYLALQRGGAGRSYSFEIDQGIEMGRASKIFVEVKLDQDGKQVDAINSKGSAVEVMSGKISF